MGESPRIAEIALSAAWHAGALPGTLATTDGVPLDVIHRGTWSHGSGPDFRDALILFDGRELRSGSVEIHLRSRAWIEHRHHLDPAYDAVILHVVGDYDGTEARRQDGAIVPTVDVGPVERYRVPDFAGWDWDRVGGRVCAPQTAANRLGALRDALFRLGDIRLAARSARIEGRLAVDPPGEVLWSELLDGLGFTANREPMRAVARAAPLAAIEDLLQATPTSARLAVALGILLGVAGFLPLTPVEAHLGSLSPPDVSRLEAAWLKQGSPWHEETLSPTRWRRAGVRPANHPVARLVAAAHLITAASERGGLLAAVLEVLLDSGDAAQGLRSMSRDASHPRIGADRALEIMASGVIPLALAIAAATGDSSLAEAAARHWERLPAPAPNAAVRRAAAQVAERSPLGRIGARGAEGLIQLDTTLCQPRRCFECPIAALELSVNASSAGNEPQSGLS